MSAQTAEKTYFSNGNVTVTNARFIVPTQTYAMSGVTSVKYQKNPPKRIWPLLLVLIGFAAASKAGPTASIWHYLMFMLPGFVWLALQRATYSIQLSSASGESRALVSKESKFIKSVVDALNQAIVERG